MPYFQERSAPLLKHVYVELQLAPERLRGAADLEAPEVRSMEWLSRRLSIREVLELEPARHPWITRRWLLRGDTGSGKTTLLRHLAWSPADAGGKPWIPVFESLLSELAARWPKSPIVATTRPIGAWSPGPEFLELVVLPFDAVRRRGFLSRWFGDEERGAAVAGIVEADRSLRELASNPLYLTLLTLFRFVQAPRSHELSTNLESVRET